MATALKHVPPAGLPSGMRSEDYLAGLQWWERRETVPIWGPRAVTVADALRAEAEVLGSHFADDLPLSHAPRPTSATPIRLSRSLPMSRSLNPVARSVTYDAHDDPKEARLASGSRAQSAWAGSVAPLSKHPAGSLPPEPTAGLIPAQSEYTRNFAWPSAMFSRPFLATGRADELSVSVGSQGQPPMVSEYQKSFSWPYELAVAPPTTPYQDAAAAGYSAPGCQPNRYAWTPTSMPPRRSFQGLESRCAGNIVPVAGKPSVPHSEEFTSDLVCEHHVPSGGMAGRLQDNALAALCASYTTEYALSYRDPASWHFDESKHWIPQRRRRTNAVKGAPLPTAQPCTEYEDSYSQAAAVAHTAVPTPARTWTEELRELRRRARDYRIRNLRHEHAELLYHSMPSAAPLATHELEALRQQGDRLLERVSRPRPAVHHSVSTGVTSAAADVKRVHSPSYPSVGMGAAKAEAVGRYESDTEEEDEVDMAPAHHPRAVIAHRPAAGVGATRVKVAGGYESDTEEEDEGGMTRGPGLASRSRSHSSAPPAVVPRLALNRAYKMSKRAAQSHPGRGSKPLGSSNDAKQPKEVTWSRVQPFPHRRYSSDLVDDKANHSPPASLADGPSPLPQKTANDGWTHSSALVADATFARARQRLASHRP